MSKVQAIIFLSLTVLICNGAAEKLVCQQLGNSRPALCINGNCPTDYDSVPSQGCADDQNCCVFDKLSCGSQGNGNSEATCYLNECPSGFRSVPWQIGCIDENYKCCAPQGLSCADQANGVRPWICIHGYCPDQYEYRSVFWDTGCASNNHRCCI